MNILFLSNFWYLSTLVMSADFGGRWNQEGVVSKIRITAVQRERGDERGCGNVADAHVKHVGEGGKGISGSDHQTSRRGQKATGDMLNSPPLSLFLYLSWSFTRNMAITTWKVIITDGLSSWGLNHHYHSLVSSLMTSKFILVLYLLKIFSYSNMLI